MFSIKLASKDDAKIRLLWIHGWGNTHKNLLLLSDKFANQTENYAVDLMGCGHSPEPVAPYTTTEYCYDIIKFLKTLPPKKTIIIGHSHGGRIAVRLAAQNAVDGIILLGGAGIPVRHSIFFKIYIGIVKKFAFLKNYFPFLVNLFASPDYLNSSPIMRETMKNLVAEDLRTDAKNIIIPTLLLYGDYDTATPVYMGKEYKKCIPQAELDIINGANHYDLLSSAVDRVHYFINKFLREKVCS